MFNSVLKSVVLLLRRGTGDGALNKHKKQPSVLRAIDFFSPPKQKTKKRHVFLVLLPSKSKEEVISIKTLNIQKVVCLPDSVAGIWGRWNT